MIATQPHAAANPGRPPRHRPPCHRPPHASPLATAAAGFTLIEVLISIIILALGLLGIGVVFPVVIRQQRISTDEVAGIVEANNLATAMLVRMERDPIWDRWRRHGWDTDPSAYADGKFQIPKYEGDDGDLLLVPEDADSSTWFPTSPVNTRVAYPAALRANGPYVWDMVVQSVDDGDGNPLNDRVRLAVFVRRIDARTAASGLAVAVDASGLPVVDRDRPGQTLTYARPQVTEGRFKIGSDGDVDRRHIWFDSINGFSRNDRAMLSQSGMKIVDAHGNVYTVVRAVEEESAFGVLIDPPVPGSVTKDMIARRTVWLAYTPQPAIAVRVFEVTP